MPKYLDPTVDLVFKKLFGEKSHKKVTIDFLNTMLERQQGNRITNVEFNDTFNRKRNKQDKLSIVDVRCTDETGKMYVIEMQADAEPDFKERCEYYVAKTLASQLKTKDFYGTITPVIMVAVLDFELFPEHKRCLSHHALTDLFDGVVYLDHMQFHFVELRKFEKTEQQLANDVDKWIFFFRYAKKYRNNPEKIAQGNAAILMAFDIVDQTNWSKKELAMYDRRVDALRRQRARIADAKDKGFALGEKKGEQKTTHKIACNLLSKGIDVITIADATGLSASEVKKLKKNK